MSASAKRALDTPEAVEDAIRWELQKLEIDERNYLKMLQLILDRQAWLKMQLKRREQQQ